MAVARPARLPSDVRPRWFLSEHGPDLSSRAERHHTRWAGRNRRGIRSSGFSPGAGHAANGQHGRRRAQSRSEIASPHAEACSGDRIQHSSRPHPVREPIASRLSPGCSSTIRMLQLGPAEGTECIDRTADGAGSRAAGSTTIPRRSSAPILTPLRGPHPEEQRGALSRRAASGRNGRRWSGAALVRPSWDGPRPSWTGLVCLGPGRCARTPARAVTRRTARSASSGRSPAPPASCRPARWRTAACSDSARRCRAACTGCWRPSAPRRHTCSAPAKVAPAVMPTKMPSFRASSRRSASPRRPGSG